MTAAINIGCEPRPGMFPGDNGAFISNIIPGTLTPDTYYNAGDIVFNGGGFEAGKTATFAAQTGQGIDGYSGTLGFVTANQLQWQGGASPNATGTFVFDFSYDGKPSGTFSMVISSGPPPLGAPVAAYDGINDKLIWVWSGTNPDYWDVWMCEDGINFYAYSYETGEKRITQGYNLSENVQFYRIRGILTGGVPVTEWSNVVDIYA
jgi:hypothetical protein